jgi:hypothetical protein
MKTSDIKVGAQYAMADNHDWNGGYRGRQEQKAERVTVIEAGLERTTHASGYGHGKKVKDGVLVSATGSPDGAKVVSARAIREPWDTFAKRRQELRDADSARRGEAAAAADAVTARLTAALPDGFVFSPGALPELEPGRRVPTTRPRLESFEQLADLLEAAVEHGRALERSNTVATD